MKKLTFLFVNLLLICTVFSQYSPPIEFLHSSFSAGYGSLIYPTDEGNGVTNLRIAVRAGTTTWTDAMAIRAADNAGGGGGLGNIGFGTINPLSKLHTKGANLGSNVNDKIRHLTLENGCGTGGNNSYVDIYSYRNATGDNWFTATSRIQQTIDASPMAFLEFNPPGLRHGLALGTDNQSRFFINADGNVGIGTQTPGSYKLAVEGKIGAREVKVTLENPWADYVFNKNYQLRSLTSLEKYINQYQHLPGLPSAEEVNKNGGIELGEMNRKLVEKVEELTLYMIELNRKVEKLEKENEILKAKKYKNK